MELTLMAVASVYRHSTDIVFEIIVVDNGSSDGSQEAILSQYPEVVLLPQTENLGFGRANNLGMRKARGEYYFLLNSDAYITDNALKSFYDYLELHADVAIAGGDVKTGNESKTLSFGNFPSLGEAISSLGFFIFYKNYYLKHIAAGVVNYDDTIKEVDYVTGADMFIRRSALDVVGMFDEDFFMYYEDTELSFRIKKAGYKSMILPYIRVIHLVSGYRDAFAPVNFKKVRTFQKSRKMFYQKCYGGVAATLSNGIYAVHKLIWGLIGKDRGVLKQAWICLTT